MRISDWSSDVCSSDLLDRLPANPCRDAGRPPAPKARDRVLSDQEVGVLWNILDKEAAPFGPAIKLLLLTGQRRDEVFSADRIEFDTKQRVWTLPGERAKIGSASCRERVCQSV